MLGANAQKLNQPLAFLLDNVELLEKHSDNREKSVECISRIKESGRKISDIANKIRTINYSEPIPSYDGSSSVVNFNREINILVVDDSGDVFEGIKAFLGDQDLVNMSRAANMKEALTMLGQGQFDMIFLDHLLNDGTSIDFLREAEKEGIETPVIVISGQGDEMLVSQVIQLGAYEYLPKNRINLESVSRVINNTLERARLRNDVKKAQAKMAEMSTVDELTKLHNRRYFIEALEGEFERASRYEIEMALIMVDLDHFKKINDTYGHPSGDMVLSKIGGILKKHVRRNDIACRYGGEEFAVILSNVSRENIYAAYDRFREMVSEHLFEYESNQFHITVSIGIAFSNNAESANDLLSQADQALYQAKDTGRNKTVTYMDKEEFAD
jgi:two-component system cell cycle response regulator